MSLEILPALRLLVEHWVVKKAPSVPPGKLTPEDLDQLSKASIETLSQRALGTEANEWGSLETLTRGWVVQRQRGEMPTPLVEDDFRRFVRFVLEGFAKQELTTGTEPTSMTELESFIPKKDIVLPDGRKVIDVLKDDPFYFAREHLAQSL
ncbi:hypothetical protein GT348_00685 [Aristophania vespae]|uniref:Uncharacterized protein n=1 Tax=Aristophania vespae TaxID=2697033 RepID=A0A6P1NBY5_9PROT|nr:hypothetical protein [Aristophania vespae]QHI95023.1 hypothetical protein GT348_00685 [Aristophania vespae]UMM64201.1 hypothetical protein DM15PD_12020 [Aristophania vespae]